MFFSKRFSLCHNNRVFFSSYRSALLIRPHTTHVRQMTLHETNRFAISFICLLKTRHSISAIINIRLRQKREEIKNIHFASPHVCRLYGIKRKLQAVKENLHNKRKVALKMSRYCFLMTRINWIFKVCRALMQHQSVFICKSKVFDCLLLNKGESSRKYKRYLRLHKSTSEMKNQE